jgi:hypothetical protein
LGSRLRCRNASRRSTSRRVMLGAGAKSSIVSSYIGFITPRRRRHGVKATLGLSPRAAEPSGRKRERGENRFRGPTCVLAAPDQTRLSPADITSDFQVGILGPDSGLVETGRCVRDRLRRFGCETVSKTDRQESDVSGSSADQVRETRRQAVGAWEIWKGSMILYV